MMRTKLLITAALLLPHLAWAGASAKAGVNADQAGIVVSGGDEGTMIYLAAPPNPARSLYLQKPDGKGRASCCTRVSGKQLVRDMTESQRLDAMVGEPQIYSYRIAGEKRPLKTLDIEAGSVSVRPVFIGVALSASSAQMGDRAGLRSVNKNGKATSSAHLCYGTEGVNLISLIGRQAHRLYLPFGYEVGEVAPVCSSADLRAMGQSQ